MHHFKIPTRQTLRRAMLIVALLIGSSSAMAGMSTTSTAPGATGSAAASGTTQVLPGDRALMLLESRDPANAGLTFSIVQPPEARAQTTSIDSETRLNICVRCDGLV